jgi:hypothetical protein
MMCLQLRRFVRTSVFATISFVALFISLAFLPSAKAEQTCLRIAFPEAAIDPIGAELYRTVMREAGLCVDPIRMPNARAFMAMRHYQVDGVFAMLKQFERKLGVPVIHGTVLVAEQEGFLVVKEDGPHTISELTTEDIGVWLGASWSEDLLADYDHIVRVPRGPTMMNKMLKKGRIDGMLLNGFSIDVVGGVPDGFVQAEHADLLAKFDAGTAKYRDRMIAWYSQKT